MKKRVLLSILICCLIIVIGVATGLTIKGCSSDDNKSNSEQYDEDGWTDNY